MKTPIIGDKTVSVKPRPLQDISVHKLKPMAMPSVTTNDIGAN